MNDMILVFSILAATIVLFVLDKLRLDVVALLALLALMLTGLVTTQEALAGFSASIVIIIAALFVVGAGIFQTGVADAMGRSLSRLGKGSEVRLLVFLMLLVALLSAFMSSTGAVAVLLPVVISLARDAKTSPAKLLIPLAFGSLIGGMLTLIGTPPNLVVADELAKLGYEPFGFFSFTPIGLLVLLVGVVYLATVGRRLLRAPARRSKAAIDRAAGLTMEEMAAIYGLPDNMFRLRVRRGSPLVDQTLAEAQVGRLFDVEVLAVQPWPDDASAPLEMAPVTADMRFAAHDILSVKGTPENVARLCRELDLGIRPTEEVHRGFLPHELGMAEVVIRARSQLVGKTLQQARFRNKYNVNVLAIMRRGKPIHTELGTTPLQFGDTLLVEGTWEDIEALARDRTDLIVVDVPQEITQQLYTPRNALTAVAIVGVMLVLMTFNIVPTVTAVLMAAVAMVLAGCLRVEDAYRSINWESIVLIAAMLPMATALEKSGGVQFVADWLVDLLGGYGPLALMAGLYLITTFFSQFISNTATTVLVAPIAATTALAMGVQPHPFLMTVAIAASTAFATPISSPVNTLVMTPGGYRFGDYAKVGVPLQILVLIVSLIAIPILFPF